MRENNLHNEETRYKLANATMAMLLLSASEGKVPNNTYALSEKIHEMKNNKMDVGDIFLSRVASGYWCNQLEQFLGSSIVAGDATTRNPIGLKESGIELYKEIIREAYPEYQTELEKISQHLKLDFKFT